MEHINENFIGWFTYPRIYKDMVEKFPSGSNFVEIGTYHGRSLSYLIVEMINAGKSFNITGVDSFTFEKQLETFEGNMQPIIDKFDVIIDQSWNADNYFDDESIDFVFIDADHVYESVKKDILAWWPKVKKGGILAGHDLCSEHIGVEQAVVEIFGNDWDKIYLDELCWLMKK